MFSLIKERKHFEQNFHSVAKVMPRGGTGGARGVKNFSVGICDGAPLTARFSLFWGEGGTCALNSTHKNIYEYL